MSQELAAVALLVPDYDEAIAYFTGTLGFELLEDTPLGAEKRWVRVRPPGSRGTAAQRAAIGRQGAGRVWLFLHTDDVAADHARLVSRGVAFEGSPRREAYGAVAVFTDRYGNRWDLIQP